MKERIGFGPRFGAVLIDVILVLIIGMVFGITLGGLIGSTMGAVLGSTQREALGIGVLGSVVGAFFGVFIAIHVVGFLYSLIEAFTGASPGKRILGLKAGTDQGAAASLGTLLLRYSIKSVFLVASLLALIPGLAFILPLGYLAQIFVALGAFMALGENKQALHDLLAKTAVYRKESLSLPVDLPIASK